MLGRGFKTVGGDEFTAQSLDSETFYVGEIAMTYMEFVRAANIMQEVLDHVEQEPVNEFELGYDAGWAAAEDKFAGKCVVSVVLNGERTYFGTSTEEDHVLIKFNYAAIPHRCGATTFTRVEAEELKAEWEAEFPNHPMTIESVDA